MDSLPKNGEGEDTFLAVNYSIDSPKLRIYTTQGGKTVSLSAEQHGELIAYLYDLAERAEKGG